MALRANTAVALSVGRPSDRLPLRLRRLGRSGAVVLLLEMAGAVGAAAQGEMRPPLQEAIHDRLGQVSILRDIAPDRAPGPGLSTVRCRKPPRTLRRGRSMLGLGGNKPE